MYCINCGKKIEGTNVYCDECAAEMGVKQEKEQAPAYQYPENPVPVYQLEEESAAAQEPEVIQLNMPQEPEQPKKNRKRPAFFPIVAAVLVVAIVVSAVFFWNPLKSFYMRSFASAEKYLDHVQEKSADDVVSSVSGVYGSIVDSITATGSQAIKGTVHLQLGEELLDLLATAMENSGMELDDDFTWLSDVLITVYSATEEDKMHLDMGQGLGNTTIATVSMLMQIADGEMYMGIPELSDEYLLLDMEEMGANLEGMSNTNKVTAELEKLLISEEELNERLNKYAQIVLGITQKAEKSTETVDVDGVSQKLNVLSSTVTQEQLLNIAIAILEDIQKDEELLDMVIGLCEYMVPETGYWDYTYDEQTGMYEEEYIVEEIDYEEVITEGIEDALDSLDDMLDEADEDNCIHFTTYVDNDDKIVGRDIEIEGEDMDTVEIHYITVWEKDEFAFEADMNGDAEIVGAGQREDGLISGEYEISVDGMDIATIEVIDYDQDLAEDGYLKGSFVIRPDDDVMEQVMSGMENSAVGMMLNISDPGLKLDCNVTEDSNEIGLSILLGDDLLIGYTVSSEQVEMEEISMPKDSVDGTDGEAVQAWVMDLDFDKLIEKLEQAGVPEDYLDLIADAMDALGEGSVDVPVPDTGYAG